MIEWFLNLFRKAPTKPCLNCGVDVTKDKTSIEIGYRYGDGAGTVAVTHLCTDCAKELGLSDKEYTDGKSV